MKVSLNRDLENDNKDVDLKMLEAWMNLSKYFKTLKAEQEHSDIVFLFDERGVGGSDGIGQIERPLNKYRSDCTYMPGFSIFTEEGLNIAKEAGYSDNPLEYWKQNFFLKMARSMAKIRALTGAEHTSPHGQNILVELRDGKPTGRVFIRDMDYYVDEVFLDQIPKSLVPNSRFGKLSKKEIMLPLFHFVDQNYQSWVSKEKMIELGTTYLNEYASEFSKQTGISSDNFKILTLDTSHLRQSRSWTPISDATNPVPVLRLDMSSINSMQYAQHAQKLGFKLKSSLECSVFYGAN